MTSFKSKDSTDLHTALRSKAVIATVLFNLSLLFLVSSLQVKALLLLWRWYSGLGPDSSHINVSRLPVNTVPSFLYPHPTVDSKFVHKYEQELRENPCWGNAFAGVLPKCEIGKDKENRSRLALALANCFLASSGLSQAHCPQSRPVLKCTASLSQHVHSIFVVFYNEAAAICQHMQVPIQGSETAEAAPFVQERLSPEEESNFQRKQVEQVAMEKLETTNTLQTSTEHHARMGQSVESAIDELNDIASKAFREVEDALTSESEVLEQQRLLARALALELVRLGAGSAETSSQKVVVARKPDLAQGMSPDQTSQVAKMSQDEVSSWQNELDAIYQRLADGSSEMVKAQELIAMKQSDVVDSLDNLFLSYDVVLHATKPLKIISSYLVFASLVYFITNTKRTQDARMLMYCVLLPGLCLETLVVLFQVTDPLKNFQKFDVQLSWIRGIVTALEFLSFDLRTKALRRMAAHVYHFFATRSHRMSSRAARRIWTDDPLYRVPRYELRQRSRYNLRPGVRRPGRHRPKSADFLGNETAEEFTDLIMAGRSF